MNFAQIMGLLRLLLGVGGASALTAAGFNGDAISHAVAGATTPGGLLLGVIPIVAAGGWSLYAHTIGATVDRAVKMDVDATATKAALVKPNAVRQALATVETAPSQTMKPTGLSRMVDK